MGNKNSGPRPRPTAIKILHGVTRADRLNLTEPTPPPVTELFDVAPNELNGDQVAIVEWTRVVPILRRCGLVSEAERSALIAMCQQWSRYIAAQIAVQDDGSVVETDKGPMVSPHIAIADKALTHLLKLWIELGLTPSGRSKMHALPSADVAAPKKKWEGVF